MRQSLEKRPIGSTKPMLNYPATGESRVESIADAAHGLEVLGRVGVLLDLSAQARDEVVDGAQGAEVIGAPHALHQLLARVHGVRVLDEEAQEIELARRRLHL